MEKLIFLAAIPTIQSAIKATGADGECDRVQLDCYDLDVNELKKLRGKRIKVILEEAE